MSNTLEYKKLLLKQLSEVANLSISPRERDVFKLRLGIEDGRQRTLEEIGELFSVKKERIRVIYDRAIRKIMQFYENEGREADLAYIYLIGFCKKSYEFMGMQFNLEEDLTNG